MKNSAPEEQPVETGSSYTPESLGNTSKAINEAETSSDEGNPHADLAVDTHVVEHVDFSDEEAILAS